jgi:GTP-binding protein HflX
LNKRDRLSPEQVVQLQDEYPDAIMLSTRDREDIKMLREKIMSYFETDMIDEDLFVPYTTQGVIGEVRAKMRVLGESYDENGVTLKVRSTEEKIASIKKKLIKKETYE